METGFYQVKDAPRWAGYSGRINGGNIFSGVSEIKTFNGQIGYLDRRLLALRDPRKKGNIASTTLWGGAYEGLLGAIGDINDISADFPIPLIFRNEVVHARGRDAGFFASFFSERELEQISLDRVAELLLAAVMKRYGDLETMPSFSIRKPYELIAFPKEDSIESLEEIPLYLPSTSREDIERRIESDRRLAAEMYEDDRKRTASMAGL